MGVGVRYPGSHTRSLHQVSEGIHITPTLKFFRPGFSTLKNKRSEKFLPQLLRPPEDTQFSRRETMSPLRDTQSLTQRYTEVRLQGMKQTNTENLSLTLREIFDTLLGFGCLGLYFLFWIYLHSVVYPTCPEGKGLERNTEDSVLLVREYISTSVLH